MIIKGKSRSGPSALAAHLGNAETNERVTVLEIRGTVSQDLRGALIEMDAYAAGTRCEKPLYHAAISPEPPHRLTDRQRAIAVNTLEVDLELQGHARVVVLHEKHGREHIHVVWTRIDLDNMRSVSDSHNYRKHEEAARDLERQFSHERVQGAHAERDGVDRPDRTPSRAELRQEERTGIRAKDVRLDVTEAYKASDNASSFQAAIEEKGYLLARGDRRDFVIVDHGGGIHSLARRIEGSKVAELREFMSTIERGVLPSAEQARSAQLEREGRKLEREYVARGENAQFWHKPEVSSDEAILAEKYSRGDDYVNQTRAALQEHLKRQAAIDDRPKPQRPETGDNELRSDEERIGEIRDADDDKRRSDRQAKEQGVEQKVGEVGSDKANAPEITDRMRRLLDSSQNDERDIDHDDDLAPDRQREAPGGGRTWSR